MSNIFLEKMNAIPSFEKRFEIVERKGIGHPDTICDLVMNQISIELSKMYLNETGTVQHHNMDKSMLVAGQSENKFGGGKVTKPMKFVLGDRATFEVNGKILPIEEISVSTAKNWFKENLRFVKEEHVNYQVEIGAASPELRSVVKNPRSYLSNDTSVLVGYAPLSKTEESVLEVERYINSKQFKTKFPESGEDIKVLGFRNGNNLELTIAMAFVDSFVESEKQYFKRKNEMMMEVLDFEKRTNSFENVDVMINNLDSKGRGIEGMYLSVLGTSADSSDSGEVGRGNMANGVISPSKPASAEATAGKNPVSHIGKIYNALSFKLADQLYEEISEFDEVFVWMYNRIGRLVKDPMAVIIQPVSKTDWELKSVEPKIKEIVEKNFEKIDEFCMDLALGRIKFI